MSSRPKIKNPPSLTQIVIDPDAMYGHTQVKTTQRYAHLSQDTLIDAAMKYPRLCL
ncbi:MAG: hypothetical protein GJU73_03460 [Ferrovum sp.]|jgi:hypothetical protein|uniref:hypothetical protein n=1 Tax=Ferrovum sp. TaxID=2609467 RepID=UPI0026237B1D|nr:hypothetical protein [Ferrovum sp.]MBW8066481.1 hypothetical protein [Ferrovum sp.]